MAAKRIRLSKSIEAAAALPVGDHASLFAILRQCEPRTTKDGKPGTLRIRTNQDQPHVGSIHS